MYSDDLTRLRHMLDAAREAESFVVNKTRQDLSTDRVLTLALVKSIEIIGEAAGKITKETQERYRDIPWPSIISMRNRLIHDYSNVNLEIVWSTIIEDLPPLIAALEQIVPPEV